MARLYALESTHEVIGRNKSRLPRRRLRMLLGRALVAGGYGLVRLGDGLAGRPPKGR